MQADILVFIKLQIAEQTQNDIIFTSYFVHIDFWDFFNKSFYFKLIFWKPNFIAYLFVKEKKNYFKNLIHVTVLSFPNK